VFDALTHSRVYKPAWTRADAVEEIQRGRGRMFDPQVVAAFVELIRERSDHLLTDTTLAK
jgi:HD-GYP domain-containing protein (c-di-GMP phosphodiesterase class II)